VTDTATTDGIPRAGMDLFEAIYTTRAMRRLKPDPIPDHVIRAVLDAAIRAPSGGNQQGWAFVVVRDPELRAGLQRIYKPCIASLFQAGGRYARLLESDDPQTARQARQLRDSALWLGDHLHEAPVIVVACLHTGGRPTDIATGSSIYPAVQNLMLAARAFGLGTTLTTIHRLRQDEVRALLDIPETVETAALIPMGYPRGRWGVARRRPVAEVSFADRWGRPLFREHPR
jgi:nitroreductase